MGRKRDRSTLAKAPASMTTVGIKELKDQLSAYIARVSAGERVVVTDRGRPVATLAPFEESSAARAAWRLVMSGVASWNGAKFTGLKDAPSSRGPSVADAVLEDRR